MLIKPSDIGNEVLNMDIVLEEIINNVNEENIAKLTILLADADSKLFDTEKAKIMGVEDDNKEDMELVVKLMMSGLKEDAEKKMQEIQKKKEESAKTFDVKIMDAKKEFRQIGIVADMVKLIIENRKVTKNIN